MERGRGPKRKAKLEPIVEKEEKKETEEESSSSFSSSSSTSVPDPLDRPREYEIVEHNDTMIYLSPYDRFANNSVWLMKRNILFIVNVTVNAGKRIKKGKRKGQVAGDSTSVFEDTAIYSERMNGFIIPQYYNIDIPDSGTQDVIEKLEEQLPIVTEWIDKASLAWKNVAERIRLGITDKYGILVHCAQGHCRSVTVLSAFLIRYVHFSLRAAMLFTKCKAPSSRIRSEFLSVLSRFEAIYSDSKMITIPKSRREFRKQEYDAILWEAIRAEKQRRMEDPKKFKAGMLRDAEKEAARKKKEIKRKMKRQRRKYRVSTGKAAEPLAYSSSESSEEGGDEELVKRMGAMRVSAKEAEKGEEEEFQLVL
jgi:hypothetical protein